EESLTLSTQELKQKLNILAETYNVNLLELPDNPNNLQNQITAVKTKIANKIVEHQKSLDDATSVEEIKSALVKLNNAKEAEKSLTESEEKYNHDKKSLASLENTATNPVT